MGTETVKLLQANAKFVMFQITGLQIKMYDTWHTGIGDIVLGIVHKRELCACWGQVLQTEALLRKCFKRANMISKLY